MAAVNVINISVVKNPSKFTDNLAFEITFECVSELKEDLEWKVVYVGSATSPKYDQELDSVLVGPVPLGTSRFVLDVPPPDPKKIPDDDLLGATVAMVTCSYKTKEFIRIGYWISNTYSEPLGEDEAPPKPCPPEKVIRNVLTDKPRVTRWTIPWDN